MAITHSQVNTVGTFNVIRLTAEAMTQGEPYSPSGERGLLTTYVLFLSRFSSYSKTFLSIIRPPSIIQPG